MRPTSYAGLALSQEKPDDKKMDSGCRPQLRCALINCYGYDYAGFLRKIEAVFGDGILQVVWILTGKGEEDRLRQSLVKEFGTAQSDNGVYEVFNNGRVALRKDKPEVLMLAEDLVPYYQAEFGEAESGSK